ncbi:MAG TPA: hypothetical protein VID94_11895 [Acidimicrobiales bacterium]
MRGRRGLVVGWVLVGCYAAALVVALVATEDAELRPGARPDGGAAAADFVDAWERSRTATFLRTGTFEKRSEVTGSAISSEDVLAQRPPERLHRQLGGVDGRDDRRVISCPSPPEGEPPQECTLGEPSGSSYDEDVAAEVAALEALVAGPEPVYAVGHSSDPGCFDLVQRRVEPRAPWGYEATFCFDEATGAPTNSRVAFEGGVVEVIAVTDVTADVSDEDLRP